jgi:glycosyltransferase involved in cell wall biosynthesis
MPVAAIEALKYGLAISASEIPGVRDVVRDGENGYTTPAGNAVAFAGALRSLLTDREGLLAKRKASWRKAREFELSGVIEEYERILEQAQRVAQASPPAS